MLPKHANLVPPIPPVGQDGLTPPYPLRRAPPAQSSASCNLRARATAASTTVRKKPTAARLQAAEAPTAVVMRANWEDVFAPLPQIHKFTVCATSENGRNTRGRHLPYNVVAYPPPRGGGRLRANRTYFCFGRYKTLGRPHPPPRTSRASRHPSQVTGLTHHRPLINRLTLRGSILGPGQRAKMSSHDAVVSRLHRTRREVGSKCNSELGSPTSPPHVSSPLSPTSLAIYCQPRSSALLSPSLNRTLRFHHSLPLVL
jgi:hypothetical protein